MKSRPRGQALIGIWEVNCIIFLWVNCFEFPICPVLCIISSASSPLDFSFASLFAYWECLGW